MSRFTQDLHKDLVGFKKGKVNNILQGDDSNDKI